MNEKAKTYICNCPDSYTIYSRGQCPHRAHRVLILTGCEADPGDLLFFSVPDSALKIFVVYTVGSQWEMKGLNRD